MYKYIFELMKKEILKIMDKLYRIQIRKLSTHNFIYKEQLF